MCVLTYLPTKNGYLITSNRDEATARQAAIAPKEYKINEQTLYFPKDPQGGGTWIATDGTRTACLLNGGYKNHVRASSYRQSRGLVVLDFFEYNATQNFYENYQFADIEPFTLVVFEDSRIIQEIRWTGERADLNVIEGTKPQIWSSATLYSDEIIAERKSWFYDFLKKERVSENDVLKFHHFGGNGNQQNDIKMNREGILKTVVITQFIINKNEFGIRYEDLQTETVSKTTYSKPSIAVL